MFDLQASVSGGEKLAQALSQIAEAISTGAKVQIGFLEGSTAGWNGPRPIGNRIFKSVKARAKADAAKGSSQPAAMVAYQLEYGNKFMKPRPFFSGMIAKQSPTWGRLIAAALKAQNYNGKAALQMIGLKVKEQLQESIKDFTGEPLKASTIARKGFETPLIDSHNMIDAVDFRVEE